MYCINVKEVCVVIDIKVIFNIYESNNIYFRMLMIIIRLIIIVKMKIDLIKKMCLFILFICG